jgi:hypothetical protein
MTTLHALPPIRTGTFDDADQAADAIAALREAGFPRSQIKVVCSDAELRERFDQYVDEQPAGARTPGALTGAGIAYFCLAAIGLAVGFFASLTTTLIVLCVLLGIALLVTFGATMMTRANERELSNYYSQAVVPGRILVAVDLPDDSPAERVSAAERIIDRFTDDHESLDRDSPL